VAARGNLLWRAGQDASPGLPSAMSKAGFWPAHCARPHRGSVHRPLPRHEVPRVVMKGVDDLLADSVERLPQRRDRQLALVGLLRTLTMSLGRRTRNRATSRDRENAGAHGTMPTRGSFAAVNDRTDRRLAVHLGKSITRSCLLTYDRSVLRQSSACRPIYTSCSLDIVARTRALRIEITFEPRSCNVTRSEP